MFVASAAAEEGAALGPDLGGLLHALAGRGLRLLACVGSGMGDPVVPGLQATVESGGVVVGLAAVRAAQPALAEAARAAGIVKADLDVDAMAWLIRSASPRTSQ